MSTRTLRQLSLLSLLLAPAAQAQGYHLTHTYTLGGEGGWDYLALDTVGHRLFIARSDRIMVVDQEKGTLLGEIPGMQRAHGISFAYDVGHGFATSGGDGMAVMFDLKTLQVLHRGAADPDADATLYEPASRHVYTFNGDAGTASVIDATTGDRIANIVLGGKPEFGVAVGDGMVFVNIEDSAQIVQIDALHSTVIRRWSIAPCQDPTGLALDRVHHRLFSVCRNGMMVVSDAMKGKVVTTAPIGQGVDAARFDPATQMAFASNGEGSITVVHEVTPDSMVVAQTVTTKRGARTMELDLRTHRLYTATGDFGPAPAATPAQPRTRPPLLPGTFGVLVLEP
jgi:YVTN family beta-propeller protein